MTTRIPLAIIAWLEGQRGQLSAALAEELDLALDALESVLGAKRGDCAAAGITARTLETWESASHSGASSPGASKAAPQPAAAAAAAAPMGAQGGLPARSSTQADEQLAEQAKAEGNAALTAGMFARAEELYTEALELCPAGTNSHIFFACVRQCPQPSPSPFSPPSPLSPLPLLRRNRAAARMHLKNHEGMAEDAREAVRLNEGYCKGWMRLGQALEILGRHAEGAAAFERALALEPDNKPAAVGRAECLKAAAGSGAGGSGAGSGGAPRGGPARGAAPSGSAAPDLAALAGLMGGAGGGGGGPGGMAAAMGNPMVQGLMANAAKDPELMAAMGDPEVMAAMMEVQGVMASGGNVMGAMMKHMANPKMGRLLGKLMGGMGGGK